MATPLGLTLTVGERSLLCDRVEAELSLSRPFVVRARAILKLPLTASVDLGATCSLLIEGGGVTTTFVGLVAECRIEPRPPFAMAHLVIVPTFHPLRLARTHRVLADATLASIVSLVAQDVAPDLVDPPSARLAFATQHDESDWAFLERLFAHAGLAYWFDPVVGKTVVGRAEAAAQAPPGGPLLFQPKGGVDVPLLEGVRLRSTSVPEGVVARDRPVFRPSVEVKGTAGKAGRHVARWPARAISASDATAVAKVDLEGRSARQRVLSGSIARVDVLPGSKLTVTGHPMPQVDGDWVCIAARLVVHTLSPYRDQPPLVSVRFDAVPAGVPQPAPPRRDAVLGTGAEPGVIVGPIGSELHVLETGEVRVRPRWDRTGTKPATARPARVLQDLLQESWTLPRVSAEVLLAHVDDDHDRPLVLGYLHDPLHPTALGLPAEKSVTALRTQTSPDAGRFSEIRFDDTKDAGLLAFRSAGDFQVSVGNERGVRIANEHHVAVKKSRVDTVKGDEEERVAKDGTEKVSGAAKETVDGGQTITVKGDETSHIAKTFTGATTGASTVDVLGKRRLTVTGAAKSDVTKDRKRTILGAHKASAEGKWTVAVTGGWDRAFAAALAVTVAQARKISAKGLAVRVAGTYQETRGATALTKTSGNLAYSSKGALKVSATGPLTVSAQAIVLDVASEVTIKVGSSTVKISSSGVEIKGALVTIPAALATLKGATVKHNQ